MAEFDPVSYIMGAKSGGSGGGGGGGGGGGDSPTKSLATISDTKTASANPHGEYQVDFESTVTDSDYPSLVACKNVVVTVDEITTSLPYVTEKADIPVNMPSSDDEGTVILAVSDNGFWSIRFEGLTMNSSELTISVVGELYALCDDLMVIFG